jgi:16S rRNA (guanine1207-N2)-methyltransferase
MTPSADAVYGLPPRDLAEAAPRAVQCSPLIPGSVALTSFANGSLSSAVILAPASTVERRHVMALAIRALAEHAPLTVLAPNDKGGTRLAAELTAFGCDVEASHKSHHRIIRTRCPREAQGIEAAIEAGQPFLVPDLQMWSQPGLFSFDRIDPASALLLSHLPALKGRGADLGCGIGVLARAILLSPAVTHLTLVDIDQRAVQAAARNVRADGVTLVWADVRTTRDIPTGLDFVVMNPPFHDGGAEDRALGPAFIAKAAATLRPGGTLWLTANRHLPYEPVLASLFKAVTQVDQANGYKIYEARR